MALEDRARELLRFGFHNTKQKEQFACAASWLKSDTSWSDETIIRFLDGLYRISRHDLDKLHPELVKREGER